MYQHGWSAGYILHNWIMYAWMGEPSSLLQSGAVNSPCVDVYQFLRDKKVSPGDTFSSRRTWYASTQQTSLNTFTVAMYQCLRDKKVSPGDTFSSRRTWYASTQQTSLITFTVGMYQCLRDKKVSPGDTFSSRRIWYASTQKVYTEHFYGGRVPVSTGPKSIPWGYFFLRRTQKVFTAS
jgi:hypothetical protein